MNSHQSGLRFLPPPFHYPGWRGHHPHHEFLAQKISSSCLYASRCKDQEPSCLDFEAEKFPPAAQREVSPLPGLARKDSAFPARQSEPPQPGCAPSCLPPPALALFPPPSPGRELTSAAPDGNRRRGSPSSSSPSDFDDNRDYEMSILLKPNYGPVESKGGEEEGEEEEETEEKHFLQNPSSLDLAQRDKTVPGYAAKRGTSISKTETAILSKSQKA